MDTIRVRKALPGEGSKIIAFYYDLIEKLQGPNSPIRWTQGVYPVQNDIENFIANEEMYIAEQGEVIVGAFGLNHNQGEGYDVVNWGCNAEPDKVSVLHLLAVTPDIHRSGLGTRLLTEAVEISKSMGDLAMRLDTLPFNTPGRGLYERFGFSYCGDVTLDYPSTGKVEFSMYEYVY